MTAPRISTRAWQFHRARKTDAARVAAFVHRTSGAGHPQCLFTWTGQTEAQLAQELTAELEDRCAIVLAVRDGHVRAVMGCAWVPERPFGWLRGPIVDDTVGAAFDGLAQALAERVVADCPSFAGMAAFPRADNAALVRFLLRMGLTVHGGPAYLMRADLSSAVACGSDPRIAAVDERVLPEALKLFAQLFPRLLHMTPRLATCAAEDVFIVGRNGAAVEGFVVARGRGLAAAEIVAVGVVPDARSKGLGARLMRSALAELATRGHAAATATVLAKNRASHMLMRKVGFVPVGTGLDLRAQADG